MPIPHPPLEVCASKAYIHMTQAYPVEYLGFVLEPLHGNVIDRCFKQFLTCRDILGKDTTSEGDLCEMLAQVVQIERDLLYRGRADNIAVFVDDLLGRVL